MKRLAYTSIAALILVYSFASLSADSSDRPAGVAVDQWVSISDRLGVVLAPSASSASGPRQPLVSPPMALLIMPKPTVGGYFMVKTANGWVRLVIVEPTPIEDMVR
jgi:hypothetical protein